MNCHVPPFKGMGYSDFYLDFVAGREKALSFFSARSLEAVPQELFQVDYDRETLADILKEQNLRYGASEKTLANIELLRNEHALCVFTGQQAGLFTGPLLVLMKALGVIKAAQEYSQQLKRQIIPVFWIAGDDHDFEESNHTYRVDRQGEIVKVEYATPPDKQIPTSDVQFADREQLDAAKAAVIETLGETDFTPELYDIIDKSYSGEDTLVDSFGKIMSVLCGQFGLVLFSPGDQSAKRLAIPFFKRLVERLDDIRSSIVDTNQRLTANGYHIQVEKPDNSTHLFCNLDGRLPVLRNNGSFEIGERSLSTDELLAMIEEKPELFSPDVMTRPVMQSYLFPVLSQKGGPAEIAYLAQMNGLFSIFDLATPYYKARPTATIVERRFKEQIDFHHIAFRELAGDVEQIINRVLALTFPGDVEKGFVILKGDIDYHLDSFTQDALGFDKNLTKFAEQTRGKIEFALKNLEAKAFASHKKRSNDTRQKIYRLYNTLYTCRGLQERALNVVYFLSKYGMQFMPWLYDRLQSEISDHQMIDMTEYQF